MNNTKLNNCYRVRSKYFCHWDCHRPL